MCSNGARWYDGAAVVATDEANAKAGWGQTQISDILRQKVR